jgi:hypothetical protein
VEPVVYTPVSAAANLRRSAVISAVLAVVAIAATSALGHPLMGVFGALGLAMGAVNNRMLQKSVVLYATAVNAGLKSQTKGKFRGGVFLRLGAVTLIAFAFAFLSRPDGLGIFVGLAVFQVLMLVGAALPVFRSLRPSA